MPPSCGSLLNALLTVGAVLIVAVVVAPFTVLSVPTLEDAAFKYLQKNVHGIQYVVGMKAIELRHMAYCLGDELGCMKAEISDDLASSFGWRPGFGLVAGPGSLAATHFELLAFFSHEAYRERSYDPRAPRFRDLVVTLNTSIIPAGLMPENSPQVLLNYDSGSAEFTSRREMLAKAFPVLSKTSPAPEQVVRPPGVRASDAAVFGNNWLPSEMKFSSLRPVVYNTVGLNLFKVLFNVELAPEELELLLQYDALLSQVLRAGPVSPHEAARLSEIRSRLLAKLESSEGTKRLNDTARERKLDPSSSLAELLWMVLYAGYGGTASLTFEALKFILQAPETRCQLFSNDTQAFMLEVARLYPPPVTGLSPFPVQSATTHTLESGREVKLLPGDVVLSLASIANRDPILFEDPKAFKPGRTNGDRLLSWHNEWRDFKDCPSVAGCPKAPRGCPGMFLSMRIATKVVAYFVDGITAAMDKEKKEL